MRVVEVILVLLFVVELPFPATVVVVGLVVVVVGLVEVAGLLTLGVLAWCGAEWLGLLCGCDECGLEAGCATATLVSRGSS